MIDLENTVQCTMTWLRTQWKKAQSQWIDLEHTETAHIQSIDLEHTGTLALM